MKRIISIILVLFMGMSMAGCGVIERANGEKYLDWQIEKSNENIELTNNLAEYRNSNSGKAKSKDEIAEIEENTDKFVKLYEEVSSYEADKVPEDCKEAHAEYLKGTEAYKNAHVAYLEYVKGGSKDSAKQKKINEHLNKGIKHFERVKLLLPY